MPPLEALTTRSHASTAEALGDTSSCALLDFPRHLNVGDSVIWMGERSALRALGVRVVSACDKFTYCRDRILKSDPDVVLLHGGGNFGDLYPTHHALREAAFRDLKGRPLVQLPQSIRFASTASLERTRRLISEHGSVTLMLRDHASERFARRHFEARVILAPDAGFALGPLTRPTPPVVPVASQARVDRESTVSGPTGGETFDWLDRPAWPPSRYELRARELMIALTAGGSSRSWTVLPSMGLRAYDGFARWNLRRGMALLARGQVVVTDRLHGHILCVLMGLPHVVVPDRYGKIRQLWETWTHDSACAHWAESREQAVEVAGALLRDLRLSARGEAA